MNRIFSPCAPFLRIVFCLALLAPFSRALADSQKKESAPMPSFSRFRYVNNPLRTRADLQRAALDLLTPLLPWHSPGCARLCPGTAGSSYSRTAAEIEGFSRPLWALAPLVAGGGDPGAFRDVCRKGFVSGTDPAGAEYWGEPGDYDQILVEMAAMGLSLAIAPELVWDSLSEKERDDLVRWLDCINRKKAWPCNWELFRVVVNLGLKRVGRPWNRESVETALNAIEPWHLGDGWYSDGDPNAAHADYYNPFAIHYYCLIYAALMKDEDPVRSELYKDRARRFAQDFLYFFSPDGSAIPYGRSMTYRFAQAAFWSAYAFADVGGLEPGVLKGLVLRHLRDWLGKPIFDAGNVLTIGYGYSSQIMSETYNAPGSPYWAMKTFLVLALPEDHPFWRAEELPLPDLSDSRRMNAPRFLIRRDGAHCVLFPAGSKTTNGHTHGPAKYEKFAYSNLYAFSCPRTSFGIQNAACDSMLAFAEPGDDVWRVKKKTEFSQLNDDWIFMKWSPCAGVSVETWIVPALPWHVRIHKINADRPFSVFEGGFSFPTDDACGDSLGTKAEIGKDGVFSSIAALEPDGLRKPILLSTSPNVNLAFPRATIPALVGEIPKGETLLISAVFAGKDAKDEIPQCSVGEQEFRIRFPQRNIEIAIPRSNALDEP